MRGWDAEYGKERMRDAEGIRNAEGMRYSERRVWRELRRAASSWRDGKTIVILHLSSLQLVPNPAFALFRFLHPDPASRIGSKFRIPDSTPHPASRDQ
jgi:hypothetical protein